jgi:hypothetical protein
MVVQKYVTKDISIGAHEKNSDQIIKDSFV